MYEKFMADATINFKPMTEKDWLQTCSFFNGCAFCGSEHIESRQFFVQFNKGGRYAPWNMIPTCGTCAGFRRNNMNPFTWLDNRIGNEHILKVLNTERKERLMEFLFLQVEKVKNE